HGLYSNPIFPVSRAWQQGWSDAYVSRAWQQGWSDAYDGRRVQKIAGGTTTTFVYDGFGKLAAEYGGSPGASGTQYLTEDHLGSTRLTTDATGNVLHRYDYLPFGLGLDPGVNGRSGLYSVEAYPDCASNVCGD